MRNVILIDVETTGLLPTDVCIEVGAILFSVEHATVLESYSSLIYHTENPVENINRIPASALADAPAAEEVWPRVAALMGRADAVLAHSAEFDRRFVPAFMRDMLPWICTKADIEWPRQTRKNPSLVPLALEHDLGVAVAHRALADCDLIARLLMRAAELGVDVSAMLERGLRPKVTLRANVSFADKDKAKAEGFQWAPDRKEWTREMVADDASSFSFPVSVVSREAR